MQVKDVRHLVVEDPSVIGPNQTIDELLRTIIDDTRTRHVYVINDDGRLIGVVRMNAVVEYLFPLTAIATHGSELLYGMLHDLGAKAVKDIMNPEPRFVYDTTPLDEMARILIEAKINELPIVDEHMRLIGQVNIYEVIKGYLDAQDT